MSFNIAQINKAIDWVWRATRQETDEFQTPFWDFLQRAETKQGNTLGEKWVVETGYNESLSFAGFNGDAFAQGDNEKLANLFVPYRTVSTQHQFTKEALDNDSPSSRYHPVMDGIAGMLKSGFKKLERHLLMGDGTARIASVTANYAGGSPTLATCAPTTAFGNKGSQFVKPDAKIQVYDVTGATLRNGTIGGEGIVSVASKVDSTGVVTGSTNMPSDMVATDIIVPERSGGRGINGLPYWNANSGSLFELSRSTYAGLQSTQVSGASGAILNLVETLMSTMAFYIEDRVAMGKDASGTDCLVWSPTQKENYRKASIGTGIRMVGGKKLDSGVGYMEEVNGMDTMCVKDHDNTKISRLKKKDWYKISLNGENPFRRENIHGSESYNLYDSSSRVASTLGIIMTGYVNLACRNVRNQGAITSMPTAGLATGN